MPTDPEPSDADEADPATIAANCLAALRRIDATLLEHVEPAIIFLAAPPAEGDSR